MNPPIVFGAKYSVYTRIARLALEEKQVAYVLEEVDIFAAAGPPPDYLERQPFAKIPAFDHKGFQLYEAGAISRYIEEAFDGPPLLPVHPQDRARVNQLISLLDSYAYRAWVWDIFVERVRAPQQDRASDEALIAAALTKAETALQAITQLRGDARWLVGNTLTLADLHAAPMVALFRLAPEGEELLGRHARLAEWWADINARPSMAATRSPMEE